MIVSSYVFTYHTFLFHFEISYSEDDGVKNNLKEPVFSLHNGLPNSVFETGVSIAPGARKSIHAYAPYM